MDFKALQKKYQQLLLENNRLKEEIKRLKAQPGQTASWEESQDSGNVVPGYLSAPEPELFVQQLETKTPIFADGINKRSGPDEKSSSSCRCSGEGTMCMPKDGKIKQRGLPGIRLPAKTNGHQVFVRSQKLNAQFANIRIISL